MDDAIWFKDLHDLDLEDLVELKWRIRQGRLPAYDWYQKPTNKNTEGITMDEWLEILKKEFIRLDI